VGDTLEAPAGEFDPELAALAGERSAVLKEAVSSLSEREQQILVLLHVHHLQGAEIGCILGVSESRVSQLLSGIRHTLKARMEAYLEDRRAA
jgi:RNA polymerase sigma factor (sigma-70 family)